MATDPKAISQMLELISVSDDDLLEIVKASETNLSLKNKKVKVSTLKSGITPTLQEVTIAGAETTKNVILKDGITLEQATKSIIKNTTTDSAIEFQTNDGTAQRVRMLINNPSDSIEFFTKDGDQNLEFGNSSGLAFITFLNAAGGSVGQILGGLDGIMIKPSIRSEERNTDPANPAEGSFALWMSDGTGSGDDGDIMVKITAGGTTKTTTLIDFSAI